jgi:predicted phosphoribosyltransferase
LAAALRHYAGRTDVLVLRLPRGGVAVPVAPPATVTALHKEVDEIIWPAMPEPFFGISEWYEDFTQVSDAEVRELLERAWRRQGQTPREEEPCRTQG